MPATGRDETLLLPDGRKLTWSEHGVPGGRPLLHHHGSCSSRLEPAPPEPLLERFGLRFICPDRPGYGGSTAQPGRRLSDWPGDLLALADALGLPRFALSGWSAGAVHALAVAARHPDRVSGVALCGVVGPLQEELLVRALPRSLRALRWLDRRAEGLLELGCRATGALMRSGPELSLRLLETLLPPPDREQLRDIELRRRWRLGVVAAWAGSAGLISDLRILEAPWGFAPEAIRVPVRIWQGEADALTSPVHARWLAERIPDCRLELLPGEGHVLWLRHAEDILAGLPGAAREGPSRGAAAG